MQKGIDFAALTRHVLALGYTTRTLGRELGLSQPAVSRLATGRTRSVSASPAITLIRLAGGVVELPELEETGRPSMTGVGVDDDVTA